MTALARIKKIEISVTINDKTNPYELADKVDNFVYELKRRGILENTPDIKEEESE